MADKYIFNTNGEYVAFVSGNNLFNPDCDWLGFIDSGYVYDTDGNFMGVISNDDRIIKSSYESRMRKLRPLTPLRPLRPIPPLRRLRMNRLPHPFVDVFETASATSRLAKDFSTYLGCDIIANDKTYLGKIDRNRLTKESIFNIYGDYGSRYSDRSIFNRYSNYGSLYSNLSPTSRYTNTPPGIFKNEKLQVYLTANPLIQPRIDTEEFFSWADTIRK